LPGSGERTKILGPTIDDAVEAGGGAAAAGAGGEEKTPEEAENLQKDP